MIQYGDGVVEDNDDPLKAGRCKIRILGIHTHKKDSDPKHGVPIDDLIWAEPILPIFEGGVSWYGQWSVPLKGSWVFGFFENGNIMAPRFFGCASGIPLKGPKGIGSTPDGGFWDPEEFHPEEECPYDGPSSGMTKLEEPDFPRFMREGDIDKTYIKSVLDAKKTGIETTMEQVAGPVWDEEDPFYLLGSSEYPHVSGFMTHGQISMEFDSTPGSTRFSLVHWKSNSRIEIFDDGKMAIINKGADRFDLVTGGMRKTYTEMDSLETTDATKYVRAKANHYIHANADIHERANGHIWEKADDYIKSESTGSYIIHDAGTNIIDTAKGDISRTAYGGTIIDTAATYIKLVTPKVIVDADMVITGKLHIGYSDVQGSATKLLVNGDCGQALGHRVTFGAITGASLSVVTASASIGSIPLVAGGSAPYWGR